MSLLHIGPVSYTHLDVYKRQIQEDYIKNFTRDNGTLVNISLIDKKNIHNNFLQVINQYEEEEGTHNTRYDVSILVNGLPLIHIELKRRGAVSYTHLF